MRKLILITFCLALTPIAWSGSDEFVEYDTIVNRLKKNQSMATDRSDPFDEIRIHLGLGLINSYMEFSKRSGVNLDNGFVRGAQASLGIDLFSPHWLAEGAIRSYQTPEARSYTLKLQEFYLHIINTDRLYGIWSYRMGAGMLARYMNINSPAQRTVYYRSPASHFLVGLAGDFNDWLSLGAELAYSSPLLDEAIERPGVDFALKMETHF